MGNCTGAQIQALQDIDEISLMNIARKDETLNKNAFLDISSAAS